jgi:16S rRNA (uracil1498-N3)-methyltransferase
MALRDFTSQRLFVEPGLETGLGIACTSEQASYLRVVLRMPEGAEILVFNGRDGEWRARLELLGKRDCVLRVGRQTRAQSGGPDVRYLFAPLKKARLDYMVQKAVELGVARLSPVITRRTVAERVKTERMRANVIEAAEQCGVLRLPEVDEPLSLDATLKGWDQQRVLWFCDESESAADEASQDPLAQLERADRGPMAVMIGPEGGFDPTERQTLLKHPLVRPLSLGPRIMRADTAAVAALSLIMAVHGDWRRASQA